MNNLNIEQEVKVRDIKNEFLYHILYWNSNNLKQHSSQHVVSINYNNYRLVPKKLKYSSTEEYKNEMLSMIILETLCMLKDHFVQISTQGERETQTIHSCEQTTILYDTTIIQTGSTKYTFYSLYFTLTTELHDFPQKGDLVKFVSTVSPSDLIERFGYIKNLKEWTVKGKTKLEYELIITTSLVDLQLRPLNFSLSTITSLTNYMSQIDVLTELSNFPLCKSILHPDLESCILPIMEEVPCYSEITSCILENTKKHEPKIFLIQGRLRINNTPTIYDLITAILKEDNKSQILLCATSNIALNSIVLKLINMKNTFDAEGISPNIVCIGDVNKMDDLVARISLSNQEIMEKKNSGKVSSLINQRNVLLRANIIVSTLTDCNSSDPMINNFVHGPSRGALKICIVDNATEATELQTLIPFLLGIRVLILFSDPEEGPPITFSKIAKAHGHGTSFFIRARTALEKAEKFFE